MIFSRKTKTKMKSNSIGKIPSDSNMVKFLNAKLNHVYGYYLPQFSVKIPLAKQSCQLVVMYENVTTILFSSVLFFPSFQTQAN